MRWRCIPRYSREASNIQCQCQTKYKHSTVLIQSYKTYYSQSTHVNIMARKKNKSKTSTSCVRTRFYRDVKKTLHERRERVNRTLHGQINLNSTNSTTNESGMSAQQQSFNEELIQWINKYRIAKRAVNGLLHILNSVGITDLPKDYRTLLDTPINVQIADVAGGKMWYNGLAYSLQKCLANIDKNAEILLNFNIDGLPLYRSSKLTFYPILASINGI